MFLESREQRITTAIFKINLQKCHSKKKKMLSMTVTPTECTLAQLLREHCNSHAQRYATHNDQLILTLATKSLENTLV
jgi:hypothetical protein